MSDTKMTWGRVMMLTAVAVAAVLVSGPAYAQGPANGGPLPGIFPANGPGGPFPPIPGANLNDPRMQNFLGSALGSFLGYMVESNMHNDRDRYYDRDYYGRDRDWGRNDRDYGRYDRRYDRGYGYNDRNHYRYYRHDW
jgi:hypothetical protein